MRLVLVALLVLASLAVAAPPAAATCVPTSGGMDYHSQACVDLSDLDCPVYHEQHTDWGVRRTCVPP